MKNSNDIYKETVNNVLNAIEQRIEIAKKAGLFEIEVINKCLNPEIRNTLNDNGYNCYISDGCNMNSTISWNK